MRAHRAWLRGFSDSCRGHRVVVEVAEVVIFFAALAAHCRHAHGFVGMRASTTRRNQILHTPFKFKGIINNLTVARAGCGMGVQFIKWNARLGNIVLRCMFLMELLKVHTKFPIN